MFLDQPPSVTSVIETMGDVGSLDVQQLQDIAHSDVSQRAALGREDLGGAIEGVAARHRAHMRIRLAQGPQPGEPVRITGAGQVVYEAAARP